MKLRHIIVFILLALASRESVAGVDSILVTVDTLCSSWHVCVNDTRVNGGVKSVILLNDTNGIIVQPPQISYNVLLDRSFDLVGTGKVDFTSDTKSICFDVLVDSIDRDAYAPIVIIDKQNNKRQIDLKFKEFGYTYDDYNSMYWDYGVLSIGTKKLSTDVFKFPISSTRAFTVKAVYLKSRSSAFSIKGYSPDYLDVIPSGTNIIVNFNVHPQDTGVFYDTLVCETDCVTLKRPLKVTGGCGIIYTYDEYVGEVGIGGEGESFLSIENRGYLPLTVFNGLFYVNGEIAFEPFTAPTLTLPISILPRTTYEAKVIFRPKKLGIDSATVIFKTGNLDPYKHSIRDTLVVRGRGVLPNLLWDKKQGRIAADSTYLQFVNMTLTNHEKFSIDVKRFYISGQDASEFSIINALIPLHDVRIVASESNWFTIGFLPDMTKPISKRYENRHATLNIETEYYTSTLPLIAGFGLNKTKHELALEDFSFSPNPVYSQNATLSFTLAEPKQLAISIHDILGREVMSIPSQYYSSGSFSNTIATSKLSDGSYILRVSDGVLTKSISFRVVK